MSSAASAAAQPSTLPSPWILNLPRDLLLFVGTPALIIPAFFLAQGRWSAEGISEFVASFGAIGHHLPGMMRAYGDRALFDRFRTRFIITPIFLSAVCILFTLRDMAGLVLVTYLWGVWHGQMQTYGFLRIYDAKRKSIGRFTARLDFAMCLVWFAAGVFLSSTRMVTVLNLFYRSGGPLLSASVVDGLRMVCFGATGVVTALFLANLAWKWRHGQPPNPVKLLLMATSVGFWWYSNVAVTNALVGIALFEVFHDVQYLSIVWVFNRSRVEKDRGLGGFTRFLFRRSGSLIGLYVGLVFAYGSLNLIAGHLLHPPVQSALQGLLVASALLHFYYDGFIWKVRERSTRQYLGLEGGHAESGTPRRLPHWLPHTLRWGVFVVPMAWLGMSQLEGASPEIEQASALAAAVPHNPEVHTKLGIELEVKGEFDHAIAKYREAIRIQPNYADAHNNLGHALVSQGRIEESIAHYQEALRIKPKYAEAHNNLGYALAAQGRFDAAINHYQEALRIKPRYAAAHDNLGLALGSQGRFAAATEHHLEALAIEPANAETHFNLGVALAAQRQVAEATSHYSEALRINPKHAAAHMNLGALQASQGKVDQAIKHYLEALKIRPESHDIHNNLGLALWSQGKVDEAMAHYQQALRIQPDHADTHNNLGAALASQGKLDQAIHHFAEAVRIDPNNARWHANLARALSMNGESERAAAHLAEARRLDPRRGRP